jgi:hypothetical protein
MTPLPFEQRAAFVQRVTAALAAKQKLPDQRTALPDQCLHSAEADVRPSRRKSGFDPTVTLAARLRCNAARAECKLS